MKSNHPAMMPEIVAQFFHHLTRDDLQNKTSLVSKKWRELSLKVMPRQGLIYDFHIPENIVDSLLSIDLVYKRLMKIFKRSKQTENINEYGLYRLYCAGGLINEDFIHLLDNREQWFHDYFHEADQFFLQYNLLHACIIGNLPLVRFLIEKKGCMLNNPETSAALASGELDLVKYILERKECRIIIESDENILRQAILSGNVNVLEYIVTEYKRQPTSDQFIFAIQSQSYEMVKHFHETYSCTAKDIPVKRARKDGHQISLHNSGNVKIMEYLFEVVKWIPEGDCNGYSPAEWINLNAYLSGNVEFVKYVEKMFPYEIKNKQMKSSFIRIAVEAGDVDSFKYLLSKLKLTPENVKSNFLTGCLTDALIYSHNSLAKFLTNEYNEIFEKNEDSFESIVDSGNVEIVNGLIEDHEYKITDNILRKACFSKSLQLVSFLFNRFKHNAFDLVTWILDSWDFDLLIVFHHCTKNKMIERDDRILGYAFDRYQECREYNWIDQHLLKHFIQYLIEVQHLHPTQEMINMVKEKGDVEWAAVLENKMNESNPVFSIAMHR